MDTVTTITLSPQEQALEAGKATWVETSTEFKRLAEEIRRSPIRLFVERARILTDVYKRTEGEPINVRHAKFLKEFADKIPVYIHPDETIIGSPAPWLGRYVTPFPECDGSGYAGIKGLVNDNPSASQAYITSADWKAMEDEIIPYWKTHALDVNFLNLLRSAAPEAYRYAWTDDGKPTGVYFETGIARSSQNWTLDYDRVLKVGFKGIRAELEAKRVALEPTDPRFLEKYGFLEAGFLACDAAVTWAQRYAEAAAQLAQHEKDPKKKAKWQKIAEVNRWVPENPARTFHEAVQCQWWVQSWTRIEFNIGGNVGSGRADQYLYPYYEADKAAGRISDDEVVDLLRMLYLKMYQYIFMPLAANAAGGTEGFSHFECFCIGGQTPDGRDATNELSYLILKSKRGVGLTMPDLAVRFHSTTPERLLHEIAETVKEGQGYPKLVNDEIVIPLYLAKGVPLRLAYDYTINGCEEVRQIRAEVYNCGSAYGNLAIPLEMALNDGRIRRLKHLQIGPRTGDPRQFKSFDDVWNAYTTQFRYYLKQVFDRTILYENVRSQFIASPMSSVINPPYMREMKDAMTSGVGFECKDYVSLVNLDMIGPATLSDSLVAIKKLVFDEKKITMAQMIDAIEANFEGHEVIRQLALHAPKWGDHNQYADDMMVKVQRFILGEVEKLPNPNNVVNRNWEQRVLPVTVQVMLGLGTAATPNGRRADEPLSEGCGPQQGHDTKGPTALLNSVAQFEPRDSKHWCAPLFNVKLSPGSLKGEEGTRRLMAFLRTYCDLRIWHIQFNVINRKTLLAAQKDPEKYRDLIVRVAGYSAYFAEMDKAAQDEIIARTEHDM
jgi:pyruvate formate-lyase/glycerol dehydratase family glycyl radical enzyme